MPTEEFPVSPEKWGLSWASCPSRDEVNDPMATGVECDQGEGAGGAGPRRPPFLTSLLSGCFLGGIGFLGLLCFLVTVTPGSGAAQPSLRTLWAVVEVSPPAHGGRPVSPWGSGLTSPAGAGLATRGGQRAGSASASSAGEPRPHRPSGCDLWTAEFKPVGTGTRLPQGWPRACRRSLLALGVLLAREAPLSLRVASCEGPPAGALLALGRVTGVVRPGKPRGQALGCTSSAGWWRCGPCRALGLRLGHRLAWQVVPEWQLVFCPRGEVPMSPGPWQPLKLTGGGPLGFVGCVSPPLAHWSSASRALLLPAHQPGRDWRGVQ